MNGTFFYIGLGLGLAAACGLRPFLPLLLAGALGSSDALGVSFDHGSFHFLQQGWWLLVVVIAMALAYALQLLLRLAPTMDARSESGAARWPPPLPASPTAPGGFSSRAPGRPWRRLVAGADRRTAGRGAGPVGGGTVIAGARKRLEERAAREALTSMSTRRPSSWRPCGPSASARLRGGRRPRLVPGAQRTAPRRGSPACGSCAAEPSGNLDRQAAQARPLRHRCDGAADVRTGRRAGAAPILARLIEEGRYVPDSVAAFPSVTPVCAASIITGVAQDPHHIPAMNWYHRGEQRYVEYGSSFRAVRRFGIARQLTDTVYNMNRAHLAPETLTLFEAWTTPGQNGRDDLSDVSRAPPPRTPARQSVDPFRLGVYATPSSDPVSSSTRTSWPPADRLPVSPRYAGGARPPLRLCRPTWSSTTFRLPPALLAGQRLVLAP